MASALAEFGYTQPNPTLAVSALPLTPNIGPTPRVVVKNTVHHFGEMYNSEVGRHTFVLRNAGPGTLNLGKGLPSCACTIASAASAATRQSGLLAWPHGNNLSPLVCDVSAKASFARELNAPLWCLDGVQHQHQPVQP